MLVNMYLILRLYIGEIKMFDGEIILGDDDAGDVDDSLFSWIIRSADRLNFGVDEYEEMALLVKRRTALNSLRNKSDAVRVSAHLGNILNQVKEKLSVIPEKEYV